MIKGDFDVLSPEFEKIITPQSRVEMVCEGLQFTEGPAWFVEGSYLIFSDIAGNKLLRWSEKDGMTVFREPSNGANGNTVDRQGRLVTAGFRSRTLYRTEKDGSITVLADRYQGKKLNSPSDPVVKSDNTIWFTDPSYPPAEREQPACHVFRLDPDGKLTAVADDFPRPNGIAFSPDERLLYVSDTMPGVAHIRVFEITPQNTLKNGRVVLKMASGVPDGFRIDTEGRIYTSAEDGIQVYTPQGELLGKVLTPKRTTNCVFGGPGKHTLFITSVDKIFRVNLATTGAQKP